MTTDFYHRNDCRICGSKAVELSLPMVPNPVGDDFRTKAALARGRTQKTFPMDVYQCRDCGLVQLLDVVHPSLLYGEYLYETSISLGLSDHFRAQSQHVSKKLNLKPLDLVIDVGCNDGTLLRAYRDQGFRVAGVDPATAIAQKVQATFGIDVVPAVLTPEIARDIAKKQGKAALVTANNVVANVDNLGEFATSVLEMLSPDGVFVLESGYALDMARDCIFDNIYHEHISYFSVKPLRLFAERFGLQLFDVEHVATKGGSIRCYFQRAGAVRKVQTAVLKMESDELAFGLYEPRALREMRKRMDANRSELRALLEKLKSSGKRIAAYGASVGAETVIFEYGLNEYISAIFDENSIKFDTFSPVHHIPVLSSEKLAIDNFDYVLVLAWRYIDPITAKNQKFSAAGGRFIAFLPEVRVI